MAVRDDPHAARPASSGFVVFGRDGLAGETTSGTTLVGAVIAPRPMPMPINASMARSSEALMARRLVSSTSTRRGGAIVTP